MTQELKKLTAAIDTIAAYFHEDVTYFDNDAKEDVTTNAYRFLQSKVLNGICYSLANAIDFTETRKIRDAQSKLRRLCRDSDSTGDDKIQLEIDKTLTWIERLQEQQVVAQAALDVAKAAYLDHTGEEFSFTAGGRAPAPVKQVGPQTEMQKRIAAALKAA